VWTVGVWLNSTGVCRFVRRQAASNRVHLAGKFGYAELHLRREGHSVSSPLGAGSLKHAQRGPGLRPGTILTMAPEIGGRPVCLDVWALAGPIVEFGIASERHNGVSATRAWGGGCSCHCTAGTSLIGSIHRRRGTAILRGSVAPRLSGGEDSTTDRAVGHVLTTGLSLEERLTMVIFGRRRKARREATRVAFTRHKPRRLPASPSF